MLTRDALLPEYRDFLASINANVYPTFNFGYPVSIEVGQGSLVHFFNRLQRGVHGRSWHKRNTDQPMIALGFWEHLDSNPHVHLVVAASDQEWRWLLNNGQDCWLKKQKRGQLDFSKIESRAKVISYITKEISNPDSQERMFVYKAPLSNPLQRPNEREKSRSSESRTRKNTRPVSRLQKSQSV